MTKTNESGRSMVEMLGVLAIIGVLSVMGIAGYTQAMKKYRANEAAAEITMGAMLCATSGTVTGMTFNYITVGASPCTNNKTGDKDKFTWTGWATGVDSTMVSDMLASKGSYDGSAKSFVLIS